MATAIQPPQDRQHSLEDIHSSVPIPKTIGRRFLAFFGPAFLVSVGPDHWTASFCELLAINSTAAVTAAGLGLALASTSAVKQRLWTRCATLVATATAAAALGLWFEPRCIGGPFAIMDPTVRTLWLMDISEMQSLARMLRLEPLSAVATAAFPILGLLATALVAKELRRDFGFLTATGFTGSEGTSSSDDDVETAGRDGFCGNGTSADLR